MTKLLEEVVEGKDLSSKKVMIVDDSLGDLRIMVEALRELKINNFILANNGGIAIAQSKVSEPDLIIIDMHLPDMTGTLLARAFREYYGPLVRIICITGMKKSPYLEKLNFEKDDSFTFDRIVEKAGDFKTLKKIVESLF